MHKRVAVRDGLTAETQRLLAAAAEHTRVLVALRGGPRHPRSLSASRREGSLLEAALRPRLGRTLLGVQPVELADRLLERRAGVRRRRRRPRLPQRLQLEMAHAFDHLVKSVIIGVGRRRRWLLQTQRHVPV